MSKFRYFILACLMVICVGAGWPLAQNINKALQLSQDPLGQFGVDTNNNVYFPNHVLVRPAQPPTLASCGTSPTISGSDFAGTVTEGTGGATAGCLITFNTAYLTTPFCVVSARTFTTASPISRVLWPTGIAITHAAGASIAYDYFCSGTR